MVRFLGTQRVEIQSEQASIHWTDLTINTVFFFFFDSINVHLRACTLCSTYTIPNPSTTASLECEISSGIATPSAITANVVQCQAVSKGGPSMSG
jgi:hypothetical protein